MTSFIQPVKVRGYATNGIDLICKPVDEGPFCFVKPPYGGLDRAYFEALGHATTSRNQYAPAVARITNGTQAELLPPASFVRHQDSDHLLVLDTNFDEDILQSGRTDNGRDRTFISTMWSIDIPPPRLYGHSS
ncbi:MAG: hypothetical protein QF632_03085 [Candidatus Woesearchaeota archaeon]|jgi:hypothetical protein|nr:hypothetical protein [Candidatus Woesearchaeota archaeon]